MAINNNYQLLSPAVSMLRKQSIISTTTNGIDNELIKRGNRKFRGSRASIFSRSSLIMMPNRQPMVQFENTYRIDVDKNSGDYFRSSKAEKILKDILHSNLERYEYEAQSASVLTQNMTNMIKFRLKELESVRYKYICLLFLAQKRCGNNNYNNSIVIASQMLTQPTSGDNYAEYTYQNKSLIAVAITYGIYLE